MIVPLSHGCRSTLPSASLLPLPLQLFSRESLSREFFLTFLSFFSFWEFCTTYLLKKLFQLYLLGSEVDYFQRSGLNSPKKNLPKMILVWSIAALSWPSGFSHLHSSHSCLWIFIGDWWLMRASKGQILNIWRLDRIAPLEWVIEWTVRSLLSWTKLPWLALPICVESHCFSLIVGEADVVSITFPVKQINWGHVVVEFDVNLLCIVQLMNIPSDFVTGEYCQQ